MLKLTHPIERERVELGRRELVLDVGELFVQRCELLALMSRDTLFSHNIVKGELYGMILSIVVVIVVLSVVGELTWLRNRSSKN